MSISSLAVVTLANLLPRPGWAPPALLSSASATATSTPSSSPTSTLIEQAEQACATGSALCDVVTEATGSQRAGAWTEVLVGTPLRILMILVVAGVLRWFLHRLINQVVEQIATGGQADSGRKGSRSWFSEKAAAIIQTSPQASQRRAQRARTLGTVLRSTATGVIGAVAILMVLSELGLNIAPLLASAGIVGVAIGFGAQSLVKDFLSGMIMIVEDQYGVGDLVNLGDAVGTVESVGLRVTQVRDVNGTLWYVPNGQITRVGNLSQGWSRALVDITIGYGQNVAEASSIMLEQAKAMREDPDWSAKIVDEPEVWGVEQMSASGVVLRVVVKTAPTEQFSVARELRSRITTAFEEAGIVFPFKNTDKATPIQRLAATDEGNPEKS
ncbi:MAG: mechanosensitive ion channel family protein [Actinomycetales bacterium]